MAAVRSAEGVERLDQPAVGPGAAGEEDVRVAIEEQQDRRRPSRSTGPGLVAEVEAGGDAAHVADLQVEDHQVGVDSATAGARPPGPDPADRGVVVRQGGVDLGEDGVGVGGDQDVRQGRKGSGRAGRGSINATGWNRRPDYHLGRRRSPPGGRVLDIEVERPPTTRCAGQSASSTPTR